MLALVLAIGVVVDDAIVVLENIFRHIEQGMPPMQAAFKAMDEIAFAIIAITIALVAVFTPLAFQKCATGQLFAEFAVAVTGSVLISAFVALTLSPMMASRILKSVDHQHDNFVLRFFERFLDLVNRTYARMLGWSLAHRPTVILVGLASLGLAVAAYSKLEKEFLPEEDKGRLLCFVFAPEGSTSEYTDRQLRKMEQILTSVPEEIFTAPSSRPGFPALVRQILASPSSGSKTPASASVASRRLSTGPRVCVCAFSTKWRGRSPSRKSPRPSAVDSARRSNWWCRRRTWTRSIVMWANCKANCARPAIW